jgi:hypothetical protein
MGREKDYMMRHVTLKKGNVHQISWIPSSFCKKIGHIVKLHDEDGWEITSIGDIEMPSSWIVEQQKNQRQFGGSIK